MGQSSIRLVTSPMHATAPAKPHLTVVARDPQRTRERILAAALAEFSAKGLAGSRVDAIARRAPVNKRMLYHYFGNKDDLFREIINRNLEHRAACPSPPPRHP